MPIGHYYFCYKINCVIEPWWGKGRDKSDARSSALEQMNDFYLLAVLNFCKLLLL